MGASGCDHGTHCILVFKIVGASGCQWVYFSSSGCSDNYRYSLVSIKRTGSIKRIGWYNFGMILLNVLYNLKIFLERLNV